MQGGTAPPVSEEFCSGEPHMLCGDEIAFLRSCGHQCTSCEVIGLSELMLIGAEIDET
jgi:hypothetical protein